MIAMRTALAVCAAAAALQCVAVAACDKNWNGICLTYAANDDVFWGDNCDFVGTDIGSASGGPEKCGSLCKAKAGCERWSWVNYQGGTCYFKGKSPWTLVAKTDVNCGFRKFPH